MTRSILPVLAVAIMAGLSTSALAQDENRQVKYKERTEIDFDGVDVSGELVKPAGSLLIDRKKAQFNPLIELRENFNAEMRESINEVK